MIPTLATQRGPVAPGAPETRTLELGTLAPRTSAPSHLRTFEPSSPHGIALIVALLMLSIVSALTLGLSLVMSMDPMAAANQREALATSYIARAGVELATQQLAAAGSWDAWLSGAATSAAVDGPPSGPRLLPSGASIDIDRLTHQLSCARSVPCSDGQLNALTRDRPWGANNPRWRPFIYGSTTRLGLALASPHHYLIAWIGDDGAERDGNPSRDGAEAAGGGVVRVFVQAFGLHRSRQSAAASISRRCALDDGTRVCEPGLRVQVWRAQGGAAP